MLTLFAADPLEYSVEESTAELTVTNQGDQITVAVKGEAPTIPQWEIEAKGQIINPSISDQNGNVLEWTGSVDTGDILLFGSDGSVTLNGELVDNASGSPLRLEPGSNTITFEDDANSSHSCVLKATWRDAFY
jgi:archaellum component FlaF (FlaF/FlaG flagellin family)